MSFFLLFKKSGISRFINIFLISPHTKKTTYVEGTHQKRPKTYVVFFFFFFFFLLRNEENVFFLLFKNWLI